MAVLTSDCVSSIGGSHRPRAMKGDWARPGARSPPRRDRVPARLRDLVVAWAQGRTTPDGAALLDVPWVRTTLATVTAAFRVNELLNWHVAGSGATGREAVADASASKVFASEAVQSLGLALERVVTTYGDAAEPETAWLLHYLDATSKRNLVLTFGGGVNEVQRELVAMFGLGLPKVPR